MKTQKKDVYRICLEDEKKSGPCYLVYSKILADKLKNKLDKTYGDKFKIVLKKQSEDSQDATL